MIRFPVTGLGPVLSHPLAVNALSLGDDLSAPSASRLLWEPDAGPFDTLLLFAPAFRGNPFTPREAVMGAAGEAGDGRKNVGENVRKDARDVLRAAGERPPVPDDRGLAREEIYRWIEASGRPLEDGRYVKALVSRVREKLWETLVDGEIELARHILAGEPVFVRVLPVDGTLQNYDLELYSFQPPDLGYRQVQWRLDLKTGAMTLVELVSHAAMLLRTDGRRLPQSRAFVPFYRGLGFTFLTLKSEPLALFLPPDRRRQLENKHRPSARPAGPGLVTRIRGLFNALNETETTLVAENKSILVRYIAKVRAGVAQEVEDYLAVQENLTEAGGRFVRRLANDLLSELYRRESSDPRFSRWACLWAWLRRAEGEPYGRFELLTPDEMLDHPPADRDLLFMVVRDDKAMKTDLTGLVHVYNHSQMLGEVQRPTGADLEFEIFLGLGPAEKFVLPLEHLHRSPSDLPAWDRWMVENRHWRKR